jgi:hypothetical protein
MATALKSASEVRSQLIEALRLDLVGPGRATPYADEGLPQSPSRWYLTGFLAPIDASDEQRRDETAGDEADEQDEAGGVDDATEVDRSSAKTAFFPSSAGVSVLVPPKTKTLDVTVRWGDYKRETRKEGDVWVRTARESKVTLNVPTHTPKPAEAALPQSDGLKVVLSVRPVGKIAGADELVEGTRSASVFLVNHRKPAPDDRRDEGYAFQVELEVSSAEGFTARPDLRGIKTDEWDERVSDLQFRNACEFAVGHGVATENDSVGGAPCKLVRTCWIPLAEVERVEPAKISAIELGMEKLADLADITAAKAALAELPKLYSTWIEAQRRGAPTRPQRRADTAAELLKSASRAAKRIEAGIACLADPQVLEAFRLANKVMARSARQRFGAMQGIDPAKVTPPTWRPFQLAFILLNLPGIVDPKDTDRDTIDLLFFPTGGGKTEAYLGLSAFTLVLRRLRNPGLSGAGVSVLMRYTLRLLTLDQLSRAATMICALELERQDDVPKLGPWPFEIGLWVGQAATPNKMGKKGDSNPESARAKTTAFKNKERKPSPIPLENCPWCGEKFTPNCFRLERGGRPDPDQPTDLRIGCANRACVFTRDRALPIVAVDEPIYRRLPCFLIATVDKFANLPWVGEVGAFFGRVERADKEGFYGPCDPAQGTRLERLMPPPDLVIQDELHLISGPMGTMVGLYETALDELCSRKVDGRTVRPKIIASTATVRRATTQIRALFGRTAVDVFPPPGPDRRDSFFAQTLSSDKSNARQYVGIAAQGRSPKVIFLRSVLALMATAQKAHDEAGGKRNKANPADPYMTMLGYFNSLRELGGCRRILEDEVQTKLVDRSRRCRVGETEGLFADRKKFSAVVELTSRVSTDMVADAKRRLARAHDEDDHVDTAIATNMISVGLDITRLGLMVVFGQPKTSAEYIQATSRVGREEQKPGLILTLLNIHKPRDRSHYERFGFYHTTFYRSVEATSVTPFSPRALDRGLAGALVALARHGLEQMTPPRGAEQVLALRTQLDTVIDVLIARAVVHTSHTPEEERELRQKVRERCQDLLDEWARIAGDYKQQSTPLHYQTWELGGGKALIHHFLDPELKTLPPRFRKFRANRSMRDVEPSVNLWLKRLDNTDVEEVGS